jgi:signal transduction histidine kinase
MQTRLQRIISFRDSLMNIWKRESNALDFIWLARFRFLFIYSVCKFGLIILAGIVGEQLHFYLPLPARESILLLWIGITLGILALVLLLVLGLGFANRFRFSRSRGFVFLGTTDLFLVLAVMFASMFENKLPLLIILGLASCITPLFVERISRYARRFTFKTIELVEARQENELLLLKHTQELAKAIEQERLSLKREIHDGLLQELSALLLQVSAIMMRNTADGRSQITAEEAEKMRIVLDRAVAEARAVIRTLNTSSAFQEMHSVKR